MPSFEEIYANHAGQYERMISFEDYEGNILPALQAICPLEGIDVVEMGAGTGRLTRLLAPLVKSICAFDASEAMLDVNIASMKAHGFQNWQIEVADNRSLPFDDAVADLAIEGWSFGHFRGWYPDTWRDELGQALAEMRRVLRLGGTMILMETLGTGRESPQPPSEELAELFVFLESEYGFTRTWIRTDFRFESREQGEELLRFFFDDMPYAVLSEAPFIVPECTGLWWLTLL